MTKPRLQIGCKACIAVFHEDKISTQLLANRDQGDGLKCVLTQSPLDLYDVQDQLQIGPLPDLVRLLCILHSLVPHWD